MKRRMALMAGLATFLCANANLVLAGEGSLAGIGPKGPAKKLHGNFKFTEGPASDGKGNVYFTDIPDNKIYKVNSKGKLSVFTAKSNHANGLMFDGRGNLYACEMDGQVVMYPAGKKIRKVIAGKYQGKRFNAPNDLVIDQYGGVYFTDPGFRAPKPLPQGKTCVYYVSKSGKVTRLINNLPNPNGVILSPDEKTLYVIPTGQAEMMAYPVKGPGKIGKGKMFCRLKQKKKGGNRGGDGLTVDTKGNLFITSALGLQMFSPKGKYLGSIEVPQQPANVTFAGPNGQTLYITARSALYVIETDAKGHVFGN